MDRTRGLSDDVEAAKAFISRGQPHTAQEIDFHVTELEAATPVTEAELAVGISFQAIALAFLAAFLAIPEAPPVGRVATGVVALLLMGGGAAIAVRALSGAYTRRALLHELHVLRRTIAPEPRPWWKRLLS